MDVDDAYKLFCTGIKTFKSSLDLLRSGVLTLRDTIQCERATTRALIKASAFISKLNSREADDSPEQGKRERLLFKFVRDTTGWFIMSRNKLPAKSSSDKRSLKSNSQVDAQREAVEEKNDNRHGETSKLEENDGDDNRRKEDERSSRLLRRTVAAEAKRDEAADSSEMNITADNTNIKSSPRDQSSPENTEEPIIDCINLTQVNDTVEPVENEVARQPAHEAPAKKQKDARSKKAAAQKCSALVPRFGESGKKATRAGIPVSGVFNRESGLVEMSLPLPPVCICVTLQSPHGPPVQIHYSMSQRSPPGAYMPCYLKRDHDAASTSASPSTRDAEVVLSHQVDYMKHLTKQLGAAERRCTDCDRAIDGAAGEYPARVSSPSPSPSPAKVQKRRHTMLDNSMYDSDSPPAGCDHDYAEPPSSHIWKQPSVYQGRPARIQKRRPTAYERASPTPYSPGDRDSPYTQPANKVQTPRPTYEGISPPANDIQFVEPRPVRIQTRRQTVYDDGQQSPSTSSGQYRIQRQRPDSAEFNKKISSLSTRMLTLQKRKMSVCDRPRQRGTEPDVGMHGPPQRISTRRSTYSTASPLYDDDQAPRERRTAAAAEANTYRRTSMDEDEFSSGSASPTYIPEPAFTRSQNTAQRSVLRADHDNASNSSYRRRRVSFYKEGSKYDHQTHN